MTRYSFARGYRFVSFYESIRVRSTLSGCSSARALDSKFMHGFMPSNEYFSTAADQEKGNMPKERALNTWETSATGKRQIPESTSYDSRHP